MDIVIADTARYYRELDKQDARDQAIIGFQSQLSWRAIFNTADMSVEDTLEKIYKGKHEEAQRDMRLALERAFDRYTEMDPGNYVYD